MSRTQIYLEKTQLEALRKEARQRQATVSAVIRAIIREKLAEKKRTPVQKSHESLIAVADRINRLGTRAPRDLASRLDAYLYGI